MKKFTFLFVILTTSLSCSQKKVSSEAEVSTERSIIDSLKYVTALPDEYYNPKGDKICSKVLAFGKSITSKLIDKIDDTTSTKYKYADFHVYRVGDMAVNLIDELHNNNEFPIRKLIEQEFYSGKNYVKDYQFDMMYNVIFFTDSEETNFKNRKRFKKVVKEWFEKQKN